MQATTTTLQVITTIQTAKEGQKVHQLYPYRWISTRLEPTMKYQGTTKRYMYIEAQRWSSSRKLVSLLVAVIILGLYRGHCVCCLFYCPLKWYHSCKTLRELLPDLMQWTTVTSQSRYKPRRRRKARGPSTNSLPWGTNFPAMSYDLSKLRLNIGKGGYNLMLSLITSVTYLSWNKSSLVEERYPKVYYHYHHYQP